MEIRTYGQTLESSGIDSMLLKRSFETWYCIESTAILVFVLKIPVEMDQELIGPLQTIVSLFDKTRYYGGVRRKVLYLNPVQNPSTKLWLDLHVTKSRYFTFFM